VVTRFEWRSRELARNSIPVTAPTATSATRRYTTLRGTTSWLRKNLFWI